MESGALFDISGTVANNATWDEDIYFTQDAAPLDITGLSFKMTFRCRERYDSAALTLSTDAGTLLIVNDTDSGVNRILRIAVPAGSLNGYCGDFVCDLASQDAAEKVFLWGHGIVTFRPNPVAF